MISEDFSSDYGGNAPFESTKGGPTGETFTKSSKKPRLVSRYCIVSDPRIYLEKVLCAPDPINRPFPEFNNPTNKPCRRVLLFEFISKGRQKFNL